jgi:glyoxylase-like metal-dependent hydrolase (beta-lactamase superfamily II)
VSDSIPDSHDIALVRADNPGPFTLSGTNTWIVGRDPCWVVDPGPLLESHADAIEAEVRTRGGAAGIVLTHDHGDHAEGAPTVAQRLGVRVAATRYRADVRIVAGDQVGPFQVIAAPGHAPDHVVLVAGGACFTGDAILGEGSVFIAPDPGALSGYLAALERLQEMELDLLCPGHGPVVTDPAAKIGEYLAHRRDRERRVVAALDAGRRSVDELLDEVWDDAPAVLRPAAAVTLAAHLDKLEEEGRLPEGVERPKWPW